MDQNGAGVQYRPARRPESAMPESGRYLSLEISKKSLLTRLECAAGRVGQQGFRAGKQLAHEETLGNRLLLRKAILASYRPGWRNRWFGSWYGCVNN